MSSQVRLAYGMVTVGVLSLIGNAYIWFTGNHGRAVLLASIISLMFVAIGGRMLTEAPSRQKSNRT